MRARLTGDLSRFWNFLIEYWEQFIVPSPDFSLEKGVQVLKDKSSVDKIIVKKQPYKLLNTNREFFPSFDASNFHKLLH